MISFGNDFPGPSADDVRPHVVDAITRLGYFEPVAQAFLSEVTIRYAKDPKLVWSAIPFEIVGLTAEGEKDPTGALKATVMQAHRWWWQDREWKATVRAKDCLPYMWIKFCPDCPPKWAGRELVVRVEELSGYPLRHCSLLRCRGSADQGGKRLLEKGRLIAVAGEL